MSLVDSDHIVPARRGRHGAHYKLIKGEDGQMHPGMILCRDTDSMPMRGDKQCPNCFWTAWSKETERCWRCGSEM